MTALRRLRVDEEGMTLVELMAAIIILGVIMMAMARTLITSLASVQAQERQVLASAVISEALEEAQGLDFRSAGLCQGPATTYFGAGGLSHTYTDENPPYATITEAMVLIPDADPYCDAAVAPTGPATLQPSQVITRRGVPYTVETIVSWFDEPSDGLGGSDPDGPEDIKHVTVTATWPVRGNTRSMTTETYIAPVMGEQPLTTTVVSQAPGSPPYSYLDPAGTVMSHAVVITARTLESQDEMSVQWTKRDGTSTGVLFMTDVNGDGKTWTFTIQPGVAVSSYNSFPNGETIFEFVATDDTGATLTTFNRGLFVHQTLSVTLSTVPETVVVDEDGNVCPFELHMDGFGLLPTDVTTIDFLDGAPEDRAFSSGTPTASGADFEIVIGPESGFTAGTTEPIKVVVERVNDGADAEATIAVPVASTAVVSC